MRAYTEARRYVDGDRAQVLFRLLLDGAERQRYGDHDTTYRHAISRARRRLTEGPLTTVDVDSLLATMYLAVGQLEWKQRNSAPPRRGFERPTSSGEPPGSAEREVHLRRRHACSARELARLHLERQDALRAQDAQKQADVQQLQDQQRHCDDSYAHLIAAAHAARHPHGTPALDRAVEDEARAQALHRQELARIRAVHRANKVVAH